MFGFRHRDPEKETWINISNRTVIRVILLVVVAFILLAAVRKASHALILIFTAFFLTLALNAPVHWLAQHLPGKRRGSRVIATATSFLIVVIILGSFIAGIAPPLARQTTNFIQAAPHLVQEVHDQNSSLGKLVRKYKLQNQVNSLSHQLSDRLHNVSGSAVSTVERLATSAFSVLAILALTFMMLIEGPRWVKYIQELTPKEHQNHVNRLAHDMYQVIKGYVNGQVLLATIAAALITPMVFILHISYPLALIVVIFICGLIPMVGHTIGAIIVTIVALFHAPISALIIFAYYILYQQIENYIIQPRIQSNTTNLTPLLVFASVIVGVNFGGLFGGLVAIPIAGCLRVAVIDYLHNHGKLENVSSTSSPTIDGTK